MKTAVVYWSGTGNTQMMAESVAEGAKTAGADVSVFTASEFSAEKLNEFDCIAFGCPSMGDEQLEEGEFEPMFNSCIPLLCGKKIALFGSYGWGDGAWMRSWEETCGNGKNTSLTAFMSARTIGRIFYGVLLELYGKDMIFFY